MIDPKYTDLPGIAYDQPDVYETDDTPENENYQDNQEDGDSVEKLNVNPVDAFYKFKDKHVSSKGVDFSDSITGKSKTGYNLCSGEWNISYRDENETPVQKHQRLKLEVQELLDEIGAIRKNAKENEESKSLTDIIYQIETTGKELESMNIDSLLSGNSDSYFSNHQELHFKELKSQIEIFKQKNFVDNKSGKEINLPTQELSKQGTLKYQMIYFPDKAKVQDIARISHLEKRLGYLEHIVGIPNDSTAKSSQILKSKGIVNSMEKLMTNSFLLNSNQLDVLETKVASLLQKMDTVLQKKASTLQDSKHEKVIIELYDLFKQSEDCSQILPQVVDRMTSLSSLHQRAAEFVNQLKELENLQQNIGGSLTSNKTFLEGIQNNFSSNLEIIGNDIASLNERLKKLKT